MIYLENIQDDASYSSLWAESPKIDDSMTLYMSGNIDVFFIMNYIMKDLLHQEY
jgi:hypothetical protein